MSEFCPDDGDLPEGWELPVLTQVVEINPPKPKPDALPAAAPVTFLPMAAVSEEGTVTDPQTRAFAEVRKGYTAFADGDVILAKITPCFENGKAALVGRLTNGLGFGSSEFHVLRSLDGLLPEFVFHYFRQPAFRQAAADSMSGTAGQERVTTDYMRGLSIPLPPLAEQRRIVEKVGALLAQGNAARARLAKVPSILKRFRQSILSAACSGRLTEDWRERHPSVGATNKEQQTSSDDTLPSGWTATPLGEVASFINGDRGKNYPNEKEYVSASDGVPFMNTGHICPDGTLSTEKMNYISREKWRSLGGGKIAPGDIVYCLRGATIGKTAFVEPFVEGAIASSLVIIRVSELVLGRYLYLFLVGPPGIEEIKKYDNGTAQPNLAAGSVKEYVVPLPPLPEQHEIVRRVDALFKLADAIEARVAVATGRADNITQAILAKAFRGELVPTEAELARQEGRDYEPASALLARIRAARTAGVPVERTGRAAASGKSSRRRSSGRTG